MERLYVKKPIYPLASLGVSFTVFCLGLFVAKDIRMFYFLGALTVLYILFGYSNPLFKLLPAFLGIGIIVGIGAMLSSRDLYVGVQTVGRIILLAYSSVMMIAMEPIYLTRNLVQLKFPRVISLGMLVTMRFIPILIQEMMQIREAMKTRGVRIQLFDFSAMYRAFFIPFVMRMLSLSDIMAVSMETRGFAIEGAFVRPYKIVQFTLRDGIFVVLSISVMIGVLRG